MDEPTLSAADSARHDLVALALHVSRAADSDTARSAYYLARRCFYGADADTQNDDGVLSAWQQVRDAYAIKLDELRHVDRAVRSAVATAHSYTIEHTGGESHMRFVAVCKCGWRSSRTMNAGVAGGEWDRHADGERNASMSMNSADRPAGTIVEGKTGGYFVRSRSTSGAWWLVYGSDCSCPAGQTGAERCWHRTQVAEFVRRVNDEQRRPIAPPNVSAMVD